jgi:hypothetical protein
MGLLACGSSQAARPLITDDARIVESGACQVESWIRRSADATEAWALPGCNIGAGVELTAGGALTRTDGRTRTSDGVLQAKTIFREVTANDWGVGLAGGLNRHPNEPGNRDWYVYVPITRSLLGDRAFVHVNVGAQREQSTRKVRGTWGLGSEIQLDDRLFLIGEVYGDGTGRPFAQFGIRFWLIPDRLQVDTTLGQRMIRPDVERWFTIGLRWLPRPFSR